MGRHPNDQRSIVKNPNNPAYQADIANRQKLGHDVPAPPRAAPQPAANPDPVKK